MNMPTMRNFDDAVRSEDVQHLGAVWWRN
jgi:hypothetical protein